MAEHPESSDEAGEAEPSEPATAESSDEVAALLPEPGPQPAPAARVEPWRSRMVAALRRFWRWWAFRGERRPISRPRAAGEWAARIILGLFAASVLVVLLLRWAPPPTTAFMVREGLVRDHPGGIRYEWVSYRNISPELALAVVASEDQRFPVHHGFDLVEIRKALDESGRRRGASTISQQVAKNLFLWPGGWVRKGLEAYLTVLIEGLWPKRRILEVYLNVAEFGPGVFGAEAASRHAFGKSASGLSRPEAARLAAVLPSPRRMSAARPSEYVRGRQVEIETAMAQLGGRSYLEKIW